MGATSSNKKKPRSKFAGGMFSWRMMSAADELAADTHWIQHFTFEDNELAIGNGRYALCYQGRSAIFNPAIIRAWELGRILCYVFLNRPVESSDSEEAWTQIRKISLEVA